MPLPAVSFLGMFVLMLLAWGMSAHKRIIPWRIVAGALALQFAMAWLTLRTDAGRAFFQFAGGTFDALLGCIDAGSSFVFGEEFRRYFFAFRILPTIIFFSALMSLMYYMGVMQAIIRVFSTVMQKTLGTSGAESLSTAANIFVGQTEAPLVIKPYVAKMTQSELMCIMVGGFATTAGGVLAMCVGMGLDAAHLMTASVIAAPATILFAKLMQPEIETPETARSDAVQPKSPSANAIDAITAGAGEGLSLALNVAACLIAVLALLAAANGAIAFVAERLGRWAAAWSLGENPALGFLRDAIGRDWAGLVTLEKILGWVFAPLAWCLGMAWADALLVGELLGVRMLSNEVVANGRLAQWMVADKPPISPRAAILATYALAGFANFSSIGIQVGGIGPLAPERKGDIARLGLRAMLAGTLATMMTACVAGVVMTDADIADHHKNVAKKRAEIAVSPAK
jgi:concentrative nucleoside transporter, CNT family